MTARNHFLRLSTAHLILPWVLQYAGSVIHFSYVKLLSPGWTCCPLQHIAEETPKHSSLLSTTLLNRSWRYCVFLLHILLHVPTRKQQTLPVFDVFQVKKCDTGNNSDEHVICNIPEMLLFQILMTQVPVVKQPVLRMMSSMMTVHS